MSVLVVGSVALDDVEAPAGSARDLLGGAAAYFAVAARYFSPVRVVGVVGTDFPSEHIEFLESRGIDLAGLERVEGRTFRWAGRYLESLNERETLRTELGVFEGFRPKLPRSFLDSKLVFLANIDPVLQREVLKQATAPAFTAMDTMNYWIERTPEELARTIGSVDALVINDEEAIQLTGLRNLVRAAEELRSRGPTVVIIKRGEHGALLFHPEGVFSAPAFPLAQVQDPTGAGDSFAGGLMGALAREGSTQPEALRRAVIYGSVMASFCVERFGLDRFRDLRVEEVEERFEGFRRLTRF
jgi:sugar/nucleoside kinase (ribokinase family)